MGGELKADLTKVLFGELHVPSSTEGRIQWIKPEFNVSKV